MTETVVVPTKTEISDMESDLKAAKAAAKYAQQRFEAETRRASDLAIRLERAKAKQAADEIQRAAQVSRAEIDAAISQARADIQSGAALVVELGDSRGWGRFVETQMQAARDAATGDQLPGVIAVRGIDATSHGRPAGVALLLDLTGRLPQPESTLTAAEMQRRKGNR